MPEETTSETANVDEAETSKQSPQAIATRIPKILHVVWVGPHRPPTEMIETWKTKHPGERSWFFVLWTQHDQNWVNQDQINAKVARKEWNGVADIMRYEILYRMGGFCVDADSECVRALDEGPEDFINNATAVACYENEHVRPGMIGCGFLGAPKHHPFFQACVEDVGEQDMSVLSWKSVGPGLMGRVAEKHPSLLRVYPARHFNPVHYTGKPAPGHGEIYAQQGWGSTKGYNALRKLPCQCPDCWITALRPPWG